MDGEPPDLPAEGFSDEARDFVRGCLHKIPKLRPTYSMLLAHPWINTLNLPPTISEVEDEDNSNEEAIIAPPRFDKEVSEWVIDALEKRKTRIAGGGKAQPEKPALHAAPLDVVSSPAKDLDIPANLGNLKIQDE